MYTVNLDGLLLFDPRVEELIILSPELELEAGKAGGFDFQILQSHPLYDRIQRLKSIIEVYQDNSLLFRGRVLNDTTDFYNTKSVVCEGELSYFNDSIVRPYEYVGSVKGYLQLLIDQHNAQVEPEKAFSLGQVTVTDPNDYIPRSDSTYPKTWEVINEKLINSLGGYLLLRRERGANYVDYLADSPYLSNQVIRLTENILDVEQLKRAQDIATAIIPLGASLEYESKSGDSDGEKKLTIESVNDGKDYIFNAEAVKKYGWIFKPVEFADINTPEILKRRGESELANSILTDICIEISAVDLSLADLSIDSFRLFEYVTIDSMPHGLSAKMLISKLQINLTDPAKTILSIGSRIRTFTDKQLTTTTAVNQIASNYVGIEPQINAIQKNVNTVYEAISFYDRETVEINRPLTVKYGIINELPKAAALLNGWTNYDDENHSHASYWKDVNGMVHISGAIKDGSVEAGTVLFVLPDGYRPESAEILSARSDKGAFRLDITESGSVLINDSNASNTLLSLAGISFRAK